MSKNIRVFLVICLASLQIAWYTVLFASLLRSPDTLKRSDFVIFYLSGKIANRIGPSHIYDADLQYQEREKLVGLHFDQSSVLPFNHPPIMLPVMRLIASIDIVPAFLLWCFFLLILTVLSILFFNEILKEHNFQYQYRMLVFVSIIFFYPLFISLLKGQDSTLLLLGLAMWLYGLGKKQDIFSGLGLSLATIRPQIAVILAIPFLFRQQKTWWWFCIGSILLVIYSIALIGLDGTQAYIQVIMNTAQNSAAAGQPAMFNLLGVILRMFPMVSPKILQTIVWGIFGFAIILLSIIWKTKREISLREGAVAVLVALLTVPHLHYHDLTIMLLPLIVTGIILVEQKQISQNLPAIGIMALSTLLLFSDLTGIFRYIVTYLVSALTLLVLVFSERTTTLYFVAQHDTSN